MSGKDEGDRMQETVEAVLHRRYLSRFFGRCAFALFLALWSFARETATGRWLLSFFFFSLSHVFAVVNFCLRKCCISERTVKIFAYYIIVGALATYAYLEV
jgi:hypothetical protein